MKLLFWFVVTVAAIVLAAFAVSNREPVSLALWPLASVIELPLYLALLGSLFVGFLAGAVAAWLGGARMRREARRRRRRIAALEHELAATQAQLPAAGETLPARVAAPG